ncbi:MAG: cupredoxin domain-containing protein [Candidatus Dojkabacteria bacterium]
MEIDKGTLKSLGIFVVVVTISIIAYLTITNRNSSSVAGSTSIIEGDNQIVTIKAKGGYSPNVITAKANENTILRVTTNNTFDCSSSLRIPSMNLTKLLPSNGNTDIALGAHAPGTEITGVCSMGMYSFKIKFS